MYKIDLSEKNIKKTIIQYKKVKEIKYKYNVIEFFYMNENATKMQIGGICQLNHFIQKYGNETVISTHDYEDTRTTSVAILKRGL